ncbi:MAG: hypothetical protein ACI9KE_000877 [Polyangiales bacterium]|jgi:hypothetical protein
MASIVAEDRNSSYDKRVVVAHQVQLVEAALARPLAPSIQDHAATPLADTVDPKFNAPSAEVDADAAPGELKLRKSVSVIGCSPGCVVVSLMRRPRR